MLWRNGGITTLPSVLLAPEEEPTITETVIVYLEIQLVKQLCKVLQAYCLAYNFINRFILCLVQIYKINPFSFQ